MKLIKPDMTPDQIQTKLNELQAELNKLKQLPDGMIGNSSDSPYIEKTDHYIPRPGEVVEVGDSKKSLLKRIFVEYHNFTDYPFICIPQSNEDKYRKGENYNKINYKFCRRLSGEIIEFGCDNKVKLPPIPNADNFQYIDLLPEGYEFCTEEEAEKWVKVEHAAGETAIHNREYQLGHTVLLPMNTFKPYYRPIRPIQYHVAVHDVVTAEHNPYAVDWANAPEDADVHAFDSDNRGCWHCTRLYSHFPEVFIGFKIISGFTLPTGLDWKLSKTVRPR